LTTFLMKIIICPLSVILASFLFTNVRYAALYQPIFVGVVLAVIGTLMEYLFLREGTLWINTVLDFIVSTFFVYFITIFFYGARITIVGAILTGLILAIVEHFIHLYLIKSQKTKKVTS
jgi:hypothetical protein